MSTYVIAGEGKIKVMELTEETTYVSSVDNGELLWRQHKGIDEDTNVPSYVSFTSAVDEYPLFEGNANAVLIFLAGRSLSYGNQVSVVTPNDYAKRLDEAYANLAEGQNFLEFCQHATVVE